MGWCGREWYLALIGTVMRQISPFFTASLLVGATCLVVSPAERERGGSSKVLEAMWVELL